MSKQDKPGAATLAGTPKPGEEDVLPEKRRAGAALRRIIEGIVTRQPGTQEMASLAERLEAVADAFSSMPAKAGRSSFANRMTPEDALDVDEFSPLTGLCNPVAPPVQIWLEEGKAVGRVNFSKSFEGAPGHVHGGCVAAVFDQLLGYAQRFAKPSGVTGTLTIIYRAPTPVLTELHLEGSYDGTAGRRIFTSGRLSAGGRLLAEAKGIFVTLDDEHHAALLRAHEEAELRRRGGHADR